MPEMTEEWVDFWMDYLDAANVSLFYSLNYFGQPLEFMAESMNAWSPRPHPRWAARLLRAEPYFVMTQTTRVFAETMYEKGDSADVEAANRAFELYDHRFFDVQCMLEQMDAVRVTGDAGQMWRLLERMMQAARLGTHGGLLAGGAACLERRRPAPTATASLAIPSACARSARAETRATCRAAR